MVVTICQIELDLPGITSLKQKRSSLKSLAAGVHKRFNVAAAEVDLNDVWQSSTLGVAVVSNSSVHAEQVIEKLIRWIESHRPDVTVVDWHVESLHV